MKCTGIPFEIDFSSSESLTSQVVQGFRTAMAHGAYLAGDRMPEDVGVVSYSNGGCGPFFDRPVTVIEHDAFVSGDLVVDRVLGYLLKHRSFPNEKYELVYRRGQTFGNPSKRPK